jgi:glycerophosphoryl diester phosphodiesterase
MMLTRVLVSFVLVIGGATLGYHLALEVNEVDKPRQIAVLLKAIDYYLTNGRTLELIYGEHLPSRKLNLSTSSYEWVYTSSFLPIAHGLGAQLYAGPNTLATFEESYRRGFRIFEVDLSFTSDGHLVCFHGDTESDLNRMSFEDYVRTRAKVGIPPCEFKELLGLLRRHPDIYFILDVKNRFESSYAEIRNELKPTGLGSRFIPQIYSFAEAAEFDGDSLMAGPIFTSYRSRMPTDRMIKGVRALGIKVLTLNQERTKELNAVPPDIFVLSHPVEDAFQAAELRDKGLRGIYTSYVSPLASPEVYMRWTPDCKPMNNWANCAKGSSHLP